MCSILALGIIGSVVQAGGMLMQGQQAAAMAEYQAKVYEQQAKAEAQASAFEARQERKKQDALAASARAQVGASGVALAGSPTAVLTANAREGELDIQAIRYGSQIRQNNLRTQAGISRFEGRQARAASYLGAAGELVRGAGRASSYSRSVKFGTSPFSRDPWKGLR